MMRIAMSALAICCLATNASAIKIKATDAQIKTVGGPVGGVWNLWSSGELGEYLDFAQSGHYSVSTSAYGSPAGKVWPKMSIRVNGSIVHTFTVSAAKDVSYVVACKFDKGPVKITVSFENDATTTCG